MRLGIRMPNRLAAERSPYLLQHADNPVDWYPWSDDAFTRARREGKPIFLSIGYSTCHWCHVMAHESFENDEVAAILNREFVPIKVDREERPDVDRVYMTFVQATTGAGGWPMSVWLTPELKPFYGGTYFPPTSRWGRPGFTEILEEIARVWRDDRLRVVQSAEGLTARLREHGAGAAGRRAGPGDPLGTVESLAAGVAQYRQAFDGRHGGFGSAPKFPRPVELLFLLREHARAGQPGALEMVLESLRAMALGGMRDHLGGGFHRYSVDAAWRVPHFEKMLYDQAQLVLACLEASQASSDDFFAAVAEDTLAYVRRDLAHPEGGFYSAEDADSVPPEHAGEAGAHASEGAFYIWADEEIGALLGPDAEVARLRFGIEARGNAPQDPQGEFVNKNLLYTARSMDEVARATGRSVDEVSSALARAREALFAVRARRPRPHLDDKVLTSWNGLMIAAFARAARVSPGENRSLDTARRAALFIKERLWREAEGTLLRRYRAGEAAIEGYCEDYAALIWGLLELFQSDPDPAWLDWAVRLQRRQDELFWDEEGAGWFSTTGRDPSVLLRMKEDYDGAEPSASSMSLMNLLALAHWTADASFRDRLERGLRRYGTDVSPYARVAPLALAALSTYHAGVSQVVIVGPAGRQDTEALRRVLARHYLPFAVAVTVQPGEHQSRVSRALPFIEPMSMREGRATAYVCREFVCREPVTDPEAFARVLTARSA
jgi:uncharacterized protein YyaL (SSP411 family)